MSLTVANVLELDLLREAQAEVVAGAGELSRPVRWVHISEQPDVARYLKGGELLLTTGMGLGHNQDLQAKFVKDLSAAGVAALGVRLGGTWKTPPLRLVREAENCRLPLIVLHRRIGFIELTEQIHGAIISRQLELLTKAEAISRGFRDLLVQGAGLGRILHELSRIVQNPVVLEDPAHQLIELAVHDASPEHVLALWETSSRAARSETENAPAEATGTSPGGIWADIWLRDERWGRLHVLAAQRRLDEIDALALDRAVATVALALFNEAERNRLTDRAREGLIVDILDDRYGGAQGFYRRATSCRADFEGRRLVALVLTPHGLADFIASEDRSESDRTRIRRALVRETQQAIETEGGVAVCGLDGDRVLSVVGLDAAADVRQAVDEVGRRVCARASQLVEGIVPVVGASDETSPRSLRLALEQATEAAEYGRGRLTPRVIHFSDLGLQHLLLRLSEGPELARFVEAELSPLLEYDAQRHTHLVTTLRAYLDSSCQKSRAARALSIERRSLYHRLERIRQILRVDLDDEESALRLRLALRALDLLRQRSPVGMSRQLLVGGRGRKT